jgi:hypothetical protein
MNSEREVNTMVERNKGQVGEKNSLESDYPANQSSKYAKFTNNLKPSQF